MSESIKLLSSNYAAFALAHFASGQTAPFCDWKLHSEEIFSKKAFMKSTQLQTNPKPCGKVIDIPAIFACKSNS